MMISEPMSPIALRTGDEYRRAAQLTAASASKAPLVLIAGTSGRELCRDLVGHILTRSSRRVVIGLSDAARRAPELSSGDRIVADWMPSDGAAFERGPSVVAVTALRSDELPQGWGRDAYAGGLARIVQAASQAVVANGRDPVASGLAAMARVAVHLTDHIDPAPLAVLRGDRLVLREPDTGARGVCAFDDTGLVGPWHRELAMVAATVALLSGVRMGAVVDGLGTFKPHDDRDASLNTLGAVSWSIDAAATTPGLAVQTLSRIEGPRLLVSGGRYGGQPLRRWADAAAGCRFVLLFGEAGDSLARVVEDRTTVVRCADLEDAVAAASRLSRSGDTVVFAPACDPEASHYGSPKDRIAEALGLPLVRGAAA